MPIFEYRCQNCGNVFEFLSVKSGEETSISCPSCGGAKTEKLLSVFSSSSLNSGSDLGDTGSASCSSNSGFS